MLVAQADHLHIAECRSISGQKISSVYKSRITVTHIVLVLSGADKCDQENEERANPYQMCKFIDKMHIWKALRQVGHIFLTNSSTRDDIAAQIPKDPRRFYKHNPEDNPIRGILSRSLLWDFILTSLWIFILHSSSSTTSSVNVRKSTGGCFAVCGHKFSNNIWISYHVVL